MTRGRKWSRVKGSYALEAFHFDGDVPCWTNSHETRLPQALSDVLDLIVKEDYVEVVIDFTSTGYFSPGRCSWPPERYCEDEGEDDRELSQVTLKFGDVNLVLPDKTGQKIFDAFQKQIDSVDLDYGDD